jgi:hypothetical protein
MAIISLDEEEISIVNPGDTLIYPNVGSCTAITYCLRSGHLLGGHFTLTKPVYDDNKPPIPQFDANLVIFLKRMQQERIKLALSISPRKLAYKNGLGQCLSIILISSTWRYTLDELRKNVKIYSGAVKNPRIYTGLDSMDIEFNNKTRQLTISNNKTKKAYKVFQDFLLIKDGYQEY